MKCRQDRNVLSAYIDGELEPGQTAELKRHLESCSSCRAETQAFSTLKTAIAGLPLPVSPSDLTQSLLDEAARAFPSPWRRMVSGITSPFREPSARYASAAIAAAGLAVLAVAIASRLRTQTVSIDLMLAAHDEYALSRPLAPEEMIYSRLGRQLAQASVRSANTDEF